MEAPPKSNGERDILGGYALRRKAVRSIAAILMANSTSSSALTPLT
jgi:hypothetical protein